VALYEQFYCARGDDENRIKEPQLDLFGGAPAATNTTAISYACCWPHWPIP